MAPAYIYFLANGSTNPDVFYPKTFPIPRGIIPQNFSLLGFAVSEELGNKQTNTQTHSLTDWRFYRVILITYLYLTVKINHLFKKVIFFSLHLEKKLFCNSNHRTSKSNYHQTSKYTKSFIANSSQYVLHFQI